MKAHDHGLSQLTFLMGTRVGGSNVLIDTLHDNCITSSAYWLNVIEMDEGYPEWAEYLFEQDLTSSIEFWLVVSFIPIIMGLSVYFAIVFYGT